MLGGSRFLALLFCVAMVALATYPASWDADDDSFPLSNYPMFSHVRPSPDVVVTHAVATIDGIRVPLEPMLSAGNREVLQSMRTIELGVQHGADGLCAEISARVRAANINASEIEILTERWDAVAYFASDEGDDARVGQDRRVHARCVP